MISTGSIVSDGPTTGNSAQVTPIGAPLFDHASASADSRIFCVGNGQHKLLSAYGLLAGDEVLIYKVVMTPGLLNSVCGQVCGCPPELSTLPVVKYTKLFRDCAENVTMHVAQDELSIPGPGCYRLTLANPGMLGRLYIEIQDLED